MSDLALVRDRYMRDDLPTRLGGLAANLARVSSFSKNPVNQQAVHGLLDESKYFIEWTAAEAEVETAAQLVDLQIQLATWQHAWDRIWVDEAQRATVSDQARAWSERILDLSG